MDTSAQYIKMCEEAVEIQTVWEPSEGDFVAEIESKHLTHILKESARGGLIIEVGWDGDHYDFMREDSVWLPRQDQLQEMVGVHLPKLVDNFWQWLYDKTGYETVLMDTFTSFEQLWLAFVMHEKYGKRWDGNEWVLQ